LRGAAEQQQLLDQRGLVLPHISVIQSRLLTSLSRML
jgi:hypothetical protein